jgi:hypothetical protein
MMLKMPVQAVRTAAKTKFDRWMAGYGLANALAVAVELQRLLRAEKKRRKNLEDK